MRTDVTVVVVYGTLLNYFIFYFVCLFLFCFVLFLLMSPAFSKKSGGTLFLAVRGAWCVVVARGSEFLVGTLSP